MFGKIRLIDLSVPLEDAAVSEPLPPRVRYIKGASAGWCRTIALVPEK
jgi:hypothetical protein